MQEINITLAECLTIEALFAQNPTWAKIKSGRKEGHFYSKGSAGYTAYNEEDAPVAFGPVGKSLFQACKGKSLKEASAELAKALAFPLPEGGYLLFSLTEAKWQSDGQATVSRSDF
jgi:hypothetical protein